MFENISGKKIAVLGDLMLDKYIYGYSERISPEAPVPIVKSNNESICLGGSGNVIANLTGLGTSVCPIGIIGSGRNGNALKKLLTDINVPTNGILVSDSSCTIMKTRVIANGQQVVRIDNEDIMQNSDTDGFLMNYIDEIINEIDLFIISDYGKGSCSKKLIKYVVKKSNELVKPVLIDPRKIVANFNHYKNCTIITPNFYETKSLLPEISNIDSDISHSARYICEQYGIENVIITRGNKGMSVLLKDSKSVVHIPAQTREVFDVSGAGDTVIATLGVFIAEGIDLIQSANIANIAAGIVISRMGTSPINIDELKERLNQ